MKSMFATIGRSLARGNPRLFAGGLASAILIGVGLGCGTYSAQADGVNDLNPIPVSSGSDIISAASTTEAGGTISVAVPPDCAVQQVLLYWHGRINALPGAPTDVVQVNGLNVTGNLIGWTTDISPFGVAYRADLTQAVQGGTINLGAPISVSGLDFDYRNNGFVLVVICDDGTSAHLEVRDGDDFAYDVISATTMGETFTFSPALVSRTAQLTLAVADVGAGDNCPVRPHRIRVTVGGVETIFDNPFDGLDAFEVVTLNISVPAGATSITAEVESVPGTPECVASSLFWVVAALEISEPQTSAGAGTGTPGYWKNHPDAWCVDSLTIGGMTYSKEEAIALMKLPTAKDKSLNLFEQLVAATLNVECNETDSSCIADAILSANAFLAVEPAGSGVTAKSVSWQQVGGPLLQLLDDYNNGRLCAPSRDSMK